MSRNLLNEVVSKSLKIATDYKNEYVTIEHILYVIVDYPRVSSILKHNNIDKEKIKADLCEFFKTKVPFSDKKPSETVNVVKMIMFLYSFTQNAKVEIDDEMLFSSIFMFRESHAYYYLARNGFSDQKVDKIVESYKGGSQEYLSNYSELARQKRIQKFVGRKDELEKLIRVLIKRRKFCPIVVGESGVGKSSLIEGLAMRLLEKDVPDKLKRRDVFALNINNFLAGAKFRGDLEERASGIFNTIIKANGILFIDDIKMFAVSSEQNTMMDGLSNVFKHFVNKCNLTCIGTASFTEYNNSISKDKAFSRCFQKMDLMEPSDNEAKDILKGVVGDYEKHYGVKYDDDCIQSAIELTRKYMLDKHLPDKAIDIIDEVGAVNERKWKRAVITRADIQSVIAESLRIPSEQVEKSDVELLKGLEEKIKLKIYGQQEAVEHVVRAVKISKAGLTSRERPIVNLLFTGGSGCGKTELAKQIAGNLNMNFMRFDMSEYSEKHTVSKLIGAPPGYIGYENSGILTSAIAKNPYSVILLDEIEKADTAIYNILLQVMDYGMLADNNGKKADFRNAMLIMTSNIGQHDLSNKKAPIGFGKSDEIKKPVTEVERHFSPEFRNRLDAIVYFNNLDIDLLKKVVDKFINEMNDLIKTKKCTIELTDKARTYIAQKALDTKLGARPIQRIIKDEIQDNIVDDLLFNESKKKKIMFDCKNDKLVRSGK